MSIFEEQIAKLPRGWKPTYSVSEDINHNFFIIDLSPPIVLNFVGGSEVVFDSYNDFHLYISKLFIKKDNIT